MTAAEALAIIRGFRKLGIPCQVTLSLAGGSPGHVGPATAVQIQARLEIDRGEALHEILDIDLAETVISARM